MATFFLFPVVANVFCARWNRCDFGK